MTTRLLSTLVLGLVLAGAPRAHAALPKPEVLSFESGDSANWLGEPNGPAGTLFIDSTVVHGGRYAARIERGAKSPGTFSSFAITTPVEFAGDSLEVRGWMRWEAVAGRAGLWQRQDASSGTVQFDNMTQRGLSGSSEWTQVRLVLPLDGEAETLVFGALLTGTGRLWVDDLELFVDGKPIAEAKSFERPKTIVETDHEFDDRSGITLTKAMDLQIENLCMLGKVWGFLKYHHPAATKGRVHWDYELFRIAPRVIAAGSAGAARQILNSWVEKLGPVERCAQCAPSPAGGPIVPDLGWLADEKRLGKDLSARLRDVHANRDTLRKQFYVALNQGVGNPSFVHELPYTSTTLPDAGYRLLALYRLWNIIEYWFPYRDVMEEDWDGVLREFLPRVIGVGTRDEYKLALMELIARVHDGHANLWRSLNVRPPVGVCQAPVALRFVEDRPIAAAYSNPRLGPACGLEIGDVIVELDGVPIPALVTGWRRWYAASNETARLRDIAGALTRGDCDSLRLKIERAGTMSEVFVRRAPIDSTDYRVGSKHDRPGETFVRMSDDLAYLKLSSVKTADAPSYVEKSAGAKCLLIDIRNYPSEFVVFALGNLLVPRRTEFARFTKGDLANPGAFDWTDAVALEPMEPRFAGRVAILVDETSQSQAEYTTMAFRVAPGAVVVGSTTAGADGNVSPIPLPGGINGLMSGIGVFYPDKRPTQRVGIAPDVVAKPTIAGIRAGRDEVIETAVRRVLSREMTDAERTALGLPPHRP